MRKYCRAPKASHPYDSYKAAVGGVVVSEGDVAAVGVVAVGDVVVAEGVAVGAAVACCMREWRLVYCQWID